MVISSSCNTTVASKLDQLIQSFPALFSEQLGTVKGMVCNIDLTDDQPVRSPPHLQALREIVEDLLKKGVIKKISPSMLVQRSWYPSLREGTGWSLIMDS
jgi:hypothetical protein